jgi:hypothetical protein
MAESVTVTNMPDSGSPARVAFDMMRYLSNFIEKDGSKAERLQALFNLYEQCHTLARGGDGVASKDEDLAGAECFYKE